jgi:hypothetical protein
MTRHGSLAYYLAAWICGCFFMAFGFWVNVHRLRGGSSQEVSPDGGLLALCFLAFITGAVPSLLFAWLLRRLMGAFRIEQFWLWITAGAVLALVLLKVLSSLGHLARDPWFLPYPILPIWLLLLIGPMTVLDAGIWATLPVGAATAGVLFAVHRAFAAASEPQHRGGIV